MKKNRFYSEAAYLLGLVILAVGTVFMEKADLGMSMVVAPAYLVYLKLSAFWPWFTFGMAEYCLQAVLILLLTLVLRRFKRKFLFSFVTAVLYGLILDAMMAVFSFLPTPGLAVRIVYFVFGMGIGSVGVSLLFHTYIAPEAYELFVKELSSKYGWDIHKVKTVYDCCSCLLAVILSFLFMGFMRFEGVKAGTVVCALLNGFIIGRCSGFFEKRFDFRDAWPLRKYFD